MLLSPRWYQFSIAAFASLGSVLFGYDLGVIAGAIASHSFKTLFHPSVNETGAVVSLFTGGAFCGAAFAGPIADHFGRKIGIFIGSMVFLLGAVLQTAAQSLGYLYAGRCIAGLGVGSLVMIVPLYQAELCHSDIRGRVTTLQQFMLGIGALVAGWTAYGAWGFPGDNSRQWRLPFGIQLIPAGILALFILFLPESPRWLLVKDRSDDARQTLAQLHAKGNTNDPLIQAEHGQIYDAVRMEHEHGAGSYKELFTNRSNFRRLFLACSIQASIQMTGVSAIQYYSVTIFEQIGISDNQTLKYQGIAYVIAILALIGANVANAIVFLVATILSAEYAVGRSDNVGAAWAFIVMTWIYQFSFSFGCGPLSWIIPAEIFDTRTRAKGVSVATMTSFAFNTMIGQVTSVAMSTIGYKFYILFIVCNATNALFFWAFLPETKKRSLEEMGYLFARAPVFVPRMDAMDFERTDLERRLSEIVDERAAVDPKLT